MQKQLYTVFYRPKVGKSDDLGPKTYVFRDMRTNNMGKWLDLIAMVMRDSHVRFKQKKCVFLC